MKISHAKLLKQVGIRTQPDLREKEGYCYAQDVFGSNTSCTQLKLVPYQDRSTCYSFFCIPSRKKSYLDLSSVSDEGALGIESTLILLWDRAVFEVDKVMCFWACYLTLFCNLQGLWLRYNIHLCSWSKQVWKVRISPSFWRVICIFSFEPGGGICCFSKSNLCCTLCP